MTYTIYSLDLDFSATLTREQLIDLGRRYATALGAAFEAAGLEVEVRTNERDSGGRSFLDASAPDHQTAQRVHEIADEVYAEMMASV